MLLLHLMLLLLLLLFMLWFLLLILHLLLLLLEGHLPGDRIPRASKVGELCAWGEGAFAEIDTKPKVSEELDHNVCVVLTFFKVFT